MQITACVRLCELGGAPPTTDTTVFDTHPHVLASLVGWPLGHGVTAAAMESPDQYNAPLRALEEESRGRWLRQRPPAHALPLGSVAAASAFAGRRTPFPNARPRV